MTDFVQPSKPRGMASSMDYPESNYRRCSRCKKVFTSRAGCDSHIKMKHDGQGERIPVGESASRKNHEPSMAELMIDAERDMAMGEPVEDWLRDMLP